MYREREKKEIRKLCPQSNGHLETACIYTHLLLARTTTCLQISIRADKPIPQEIQYEDVPSLSTEAVEKLGQIRPTTIGQAQRIGGVNPADISALLIHIETKRRQQQQQQQQPSVSTTLG